MSSDVAHELVPKGKGKHLNSFYLEKKEKYKQLDDSISDSLNLAYDPVSLLEILLTYLTNY